MKNIFGYLFVMIVCLASCKQAPKTIKIIRDSVVKNIKINSAPDTAEYLDWTSVRN